MGHSKQPHTAVSEPATTPPVSPTPSHQGSILSRTALLTSSSISQGVSSLKTAVKNGIKKGAKAIGRPFKKTHGTSMVDNSSKDSDEVGSSHGSSDDPVKQLGSLFTSITSTFTETTQRNSNVPGTRLCITSSSLKLLSKPIKAGLATSLHVPLADARLLWGGSSFSGLKG
jgi:hypothetical protein